MTAPLNWRLGEYLIARELDHGQFGIVFEATHATYGSVALKLIHLGGPDSEEKVAAERQGVVLQQRFGRAHPHLVPEVFEHKPIDTYYAVAMELVRGESLSALLARGPLDSRHAAEIALAIARFLEKAHEFKAELDGSPEIIVHGDMKPAHVLLMPDGSMRVLDFGIAKALARKPETTNKWGSIHYASPERLESGHVNEHVDFWSLGVIAFEMTAGLRPYHQHEGHPSRLESAIRRQEPRAPISAAVEPVLAAIIGKLLAPQAERRYQSAGDIVRDLTAFLAGQATIAAAEAADAGRETVRLSPPSLPTRATTTVPTEPIPRSGHASVTPLTPATPRSPVSSRLGGMLTRNLATLAAVLVVVLLVGVEGVGFARAGRFKRVIPALDATDISAARTAYRTIGAWAPIGLGTLRVRGALRDHMVELADRTIKEYRADAPALSKVQWDQARACLTLAREIAPRDDTVAAKLAYVRGRLAWIGARTRDGENAALRDEAIRSLRESARLDPRSPDPYLGLAAIFAYSTRDLPALTDAISQAERRGYTRGRRERAELGDVHKVIADRAAARARATQDVERVEQLKEAYDNYTKCVEYFDGLRLGDSEKSLGLCRTRLRDVSQTLASLVALSGSDLAETTSPRTEDD